MRLSPIGFRSSVCLRNILFLKGCSWNSLYQFHAQLCTPVLSVNVFLLKFFYICLCLHNSGYCFYIMHQKQFPSFSQHPLGQCYLYERLHTTTENQKLIFRNRFINKENLSISFSPNALKADAICLASTIHQARLQENNHTTDNYQNKKTPPQETIRNKNKSY